MTRRRIDDPNRPTCDKCGRPMRRNGHSATGQQKYVCAMCAVPDEDVDHPWPVPVTLRKPAVRAPFGGCKCCCYRSECAELLREGLPVLCERTAMVLVGTTKTAMMV